LDSFFVNTYAAEQFEPLIASELKNVIQPLTVMSVQTFEMVLPYTSVGDVSWQELIERRFVGGRVVNGMMSAYQAIYDWRKDSRRDVRRNEFVMSGFYAAMDQGIGSFKE
jgi:hypothetical protein